MGMKGDLATALATALRDNGVSPDQPVDKVEARTILDNAFALARTDTCFVRAADDEPLFVLRAQDRIAVGAIRDWAERARKAGVPPEKAAEAMDCALRFEAWQKKYPGLTKFPD